MMRISQEWRAVFRSSGLLGFYAAVFLVNGLLFHEPYHQNDLLLVIAMVAFIANAPLSWWWAPLPACIGLGLVDALLAWLVGHAVGLEGSRSLLQLLRHGLMAGLIGGVVYGGLAWRTHRKLQGASGHRPGAPAA